MFNGFMGKYAVHLRNGGFEIGFENIDKGVIGPLTQQIVAGLSGDAAADRFGVAAVAAAGAFDAQLQRGEDGDGPIDRTLQPRFCLLYTSRCV